MTPAARFLESSACSNFTGSIPRTIRPNIEMKRRYASHAKRSFFMSLASAARVSSLRPRLRTVSIIPGMLIAAPERTETRSGFFGSPSFFPAARSTAASAFSTCSQRPGGSLRPEAKYALQAAVVIVKPGGTGSFAFVISARPAPLPPRRSRIFALPSALPFAKR